MSSGKREGRGQTQRRCDKWDVHSGREMPVGKCALMAGRRDNPEARETDSSKAPRRERSQMRRCLGPNTCSKWQMVAQKVFSVTQNQVKSHGAVQKRTRCSCSGSNSSSGGKETTLLGPSRCLQLRVCSYFLKTLCTNSKLLK